MYFLSHSDSDDDYVSDVVPHFGQLSSFLSFYLIGILYLGEMENDILKNLDRDRTSQNLPEKS